MTVVRIGSSLRYSGLSTDEKPTRVGAVALSNGSTFTETDTNRTWTFDGVRWWAPDDVMSTSTIESLLAEQNTLLRGIRLGMAHLSGIDLTEVP